jgi:hypothetical protein
MKGKKEITTDMIFILDRSGSMAGLEAGTISGFNEMLGKQKALPGRARVTTVLFDDEYEVLYERLPLDKVPAMDDDQYWVRGCTALLDAVGRTIAGETVERMKQGPNEKSDLVVVVIITDGLENASREYSRAQVCQMIQNQKRKGWEFIFLGANMDAVTEAGNLGIAPDRAVTYFNDAAGVEACYQAVDTAMSEMRICSNEVGSKWKDAVEADRKRRG